MHLGKILAIVAALALPATSSPVAGQNLVRAESSPAAARPSPAIDRTTLLAMAESLATKLADQGAKNVFVMDFDKSVPDGIMPWQEDAHPTLADQFSLALSKASHEFDVIDRRWYTTLLKQYSKYSWWELVPPDPLSIGHTVGADTVVEGGYEIAAGGLRLTVAAYRISTTVRCISVEVGVLAWPLDDSVLLALNRATNSIDPAPPPFWPSDLGWIRSENRQQPKCLSCPMPLLAIDGRSAGPAGAVLVRALITTEGRPTGIEVLVSLSAERDAQAIQVVKNWKFEPGRKTLGGTIVASEIAAWITFKSD